MWVKEARLSILVHLSVAANRKISLFHFFLGRSVLVFEGLSWLHRFIFLAMHINYNKFLG